MPATISARNLTKRFGKLVAVNDVSFEVGKGEIFAFLGPNGAGKTTTIKMLTTLLHPTTGSVRLDGSDPIHNPDAARRSFGIVFQDPSLDDELTAWENLEIHAALYSLPRAKARERMIALLKLVELWDRKDSLVKTYSGGMKRRLEIARGLLHHPKVLFLDEPTLGLDPQTRNKLWASVRELSKREGTTVFFTTHYMEEAEKAAHRVAIIDRGKIIAQGSPAELKKRTKTRTLEAAFLKLTGHAIREETASSMDQLRTHARMWGRR